MKVGGRGVGQNPIVSFYLYTGLTIPKGGIGPSGDDDCMVWLKSDKKKEVMQRKEKGEEPNQSFSKS